MTKDGGMVTQPWVVDRGIATADVRIAARIRPENSRVRGSGQPPNARGIPVAIAITAKAAPAERRGDIRIRLPHRVRQRNPLRVERARREPLSGLVAQLAAGECVSEDLAQRWSGAMVSRFGTCSGRKQP